LRTVLLDVKTVDASKRVVFKKESEVIAKQYTTDVHCIADGLFPLTSNQNEAPRFQWMRYLQSIRNPSFYANHELPNEEELDRRDQILKTAFQGIEDTILAVYVVPDSYHLGEICEIFEKLNTTGTKVSTVDLIHSWLYRETKTDIEGPIDLRQWIDELGQKDGAIGWANSSDRPELVCFQVTDQAAAPSKEMPNHSPATVRSSV
jgi:hypothetical protein